MSRSNETINLTVTTTGITQENVLTQIVFTDGDGDTLEPGQDWSKFKTPLNGSANITWSANAVESGKTIHISSIAQNDPNADFFAPNRAPSGPDGMGSWSAKVKGSNPNQDIDCEYTIKFYIDNDPATVYTIDPKLQIKKST